MLQGYPEAAKLLIQTSIPVSCFKPGVSVTNTNYGGQVRGLGFYSVPRGTGAPHLEEQSFNIPVWGVVIIASCLYPLCPYPPVHIHRVFVAWDPNNQHRVQWERGETVSWWSAISVISWCICSLSLLRKRNVLLLRLAPAGSFFPTHTVVRS